MFSFGVISVRMGNNIFGVFAESLDVVLSMFKSFIDTEKRGTSYHEVGRDPSEVE